jgi:hypothetical protein
VLLSTGQAAPRIALRAGCDFKPIVPLPARLEPVDRGLGVAEPVPKATVRQVRGSAAGLFYGEDLKSFGRKAWPTYEEGVALLTVVDAGAPADDVPVVEH